MYRRQMLEKRLAEEKRLDVLNIQGHLNLMRLIYIQYLSYKI